MELYFIFLALVFLFMMIRTFFKNNKYIEVIIDVIIFLGIFLFSGLRYYVGYDYAAYVNRIKEYTLFGLSAVGKENEILSNRLIILASDFSNDQLFFLINSFITTLLIFITIKKYSTDFNLSIWIFLCFPLFYLNSFSIVRSFTAIAIMFFAVRYIEKKQFYKYFLMVIIATLFHNTAIITIILYWLKDIKISKKSIFLIFGVSIVSEPIIRFIFLRIFPDYSVYMQEESVTAGTKTIFVLYLIIILSTIYKGKLIERNALNNFYYNALVVGIFFYTMFFNYGTVAYRGTLYMYIFIIFLIPNLISLVNKEERLLFKYFIYILFLIMFLYMLKVGGAYYVPYKINPYLLN